MRRCVTASICSRTDRLSARSSIESPKLAADDLTNRLEEGIKDTEHVTPVPASRFATLVEASGQFAEPGRLLAPYRDF